MAVVSTGSLSSGFIASDENDTYFTAAGDLITANSVGFGFSTIANTEYVLLGTIITQANGISSVFSSAGNLDVIIGPTGSVFADFDGIDLNGNGNQIFNNGLITARSGDAIEYSGDQALVSNAGALDAGTTGISYDGDDVFIANSGSINARVDGISMSFGSDGIVQNTGTINAEQWGVRIGSSFSDATITNTGTITGAFGGIATRENLTLVSADRVTILNHGIISSEFEAISIRGEDARVHNTGGISGGDFGVYFFGGAPRLLNTGEVAATGVAVTLLGNAATVSNTGTIIGGDLAIEADNGTETIRNLGQITGDVELGGGADRFTNLASGIVFGAVDGGSGDDTLIGGDLNDVLSGGADFDLLLGGRGDDGLVGGEGADTLNGGAGADVLSGGFDADRMTGGDGDDLVRGDAGDDILSGTPGRTCLKAAPETIGFRAAPAPTRSRAATMTTA